jgi:hypothetical protein
MIAAYYYINYTTIGKNTVDVRNNSRTQLNRDDFISMMLLS